MDTNKLIAVVTIIVTLSLATEKLVEIIKGYFVNYYKAPDLNEIGAPINPEEEIKHKTRVQVLAIICGIVTALLASPILAGIFKDLFPAGTNCKVYGFFDLGSTGNCGFELNGGASLLIIIALGLLASGGSGLWNSILEYLLKLKDLKKVEVVRARQMTRIEVAMARKDALDKGANLNAEPNNSVK